MSNKKKGIFEQIKAAFKTPEGDDYYDDYDYSGEPDYMTTNIGENLYSDKIKATVEVDDDYNNSYRGEEKMRHTNINSDVSAYSSGEIGMEVKKPNFSFGDELTLEKITNLSSDIVSLLQQNKTVFLDLMDLGDDERTVLTYVVLGAANALNYNITNVRDHMIFVLTPEGINVAQDERVRLDSNESPRLKYSNDYDGE